MPSVNPLRELLQPIEEEAGGKNIRVVPQAGGGDSDEVSPAVAAICQYNRGDVHPCLKEVKPADVGLPESREAEYEDKERCPDQYQPFRSAKVQIWSLRHDGGTWGRGEKFPG